MKTGFNMLADANADTSDDFMKMVAALLSVLCEEAMHTAVRFTQCCGRNVVTAQDTMLALKYESHKFWDKDIDNRFVECLRTQNNDPDLSDADSDVENSGDEQCDDGESEEAEDQDEPAFHTVAQDGCDIAFYEQVMKIVAEWSEWNPEDPVKLLLKRAIDSTSKSCLQGH